MTFDRDKYTEYEKQYYKHSDLNDIDVEKMIGMTDKKDICRLVLYSHSDGYLLWLNGIAGG